MLFRSPEEMFDDPHLLSNGSLGETTLPDGRKTRLPNLPIEMDGRRPSVGGILAKIGEHTDEVLSSLGVSAAELATLRESKVVG